MKKHQKKTRFNIRKTTRTTRRILHAKMKFQSWIKMNTLLRAFLLCVLLTSVNSENKSLEVLNSQAEAEQNNSNTNFLHHFQHFRKQHRNKNKFLDNQNRPNNMKRESLYNTNEPTTTNADEQHQIFLNQSNNVFILAKYGQTVSLPCIIYRQLNQDLTNIHAIWHKLTEKQRPIVLSIGLQQLKQDMRYRVKVVDLIDKQNNDNLKTGQSVELTTSAENQNQTASSDEFNSNSSHEEEKYLIQNWQFEIRKLTYEDAGTYTCLLPLVKPITKNITLQVIPDLVIEPKEASFKVNDKIVIKCKATLKSHHKNGMNKAYTFNNINHTTNPHHQRHQRMHKPNIYWYKENEILKDTDLNRNKIRHDPSQNQQSEYFDDNKIEIDTKQDLDENLLNSVLTINNAKINDSGNYRCIYDNIQEQVTVKVLPDDYFNYKSYLFSSSSSSSASSTFLFFSSAQLFNPIISTGVASFMLFNLL